ARRAPGSSGGARAAWRDARPAHLLPGARLGSLPRRLAQRRQRAAGLDVLTRTEGSARTPAAIRASLPQKLAHRRTELRGRAHGAYAGFFERAVLFGGGALPARDDRARVAHALARRGGHTRDVRHDRLGHALADEARGGLLVAPADLADENDAFGLRVPLEEREHIDEIHATHRIATDPDARALSEARVRRLE